MSDDRALDAKAARADVAPAVTDDDTQGEERSGFLAMAGWGIAGFVLGAVFWHLVGFWTFIDTIVRKGPQPESRLEAEVRTPLRTVKRQGAVPADQAAATAALLARCTQLALDRATGLTSARPCTADVPPSRDVETPTRGDRTIVAFEPQAEAAPQQ